MRPTNAGKSRKSSADNAPLLAALSTASGCALALGLSVLLLLLAVLVAGAH